MTAILKIDPRLLTATLLLALSLTIFQAYGQSAYWISSTEFIIYRDGMSQITQIIYVNGNTSSISLSLFSQTVENILAIDQDYMPLSYEILMPPNITIITLGAPKVTLSYLTSELTKKEGNVWTFNINTPYDSTIILPEQSNIVYLNDLPLSITTKDEKTVLMVQAGLWEISYILPITPPPSPTPTPTTTTSTATPSPTSTATTTSTSTTITTTPSSTTTTISPSPTSTTTQTTTQTTVSTQTTTQSTSKPSTTTTQALQSQETSNLTIFLALIIVAAVGITTIILILKFRASKTATSELRREEQELLSYLAERGGRALESELRQRFNLPKSSMWRLAKRLESMGYIRINKAGIQNEIELLRRGIWP